MISAEIVILPDGAAASAVFGPGAMFQPVCPDTSAVGGEAAPGD